MKHGRISSLLLVFVLLALPAAAQQQQPPPQMSTVYFITVKAGEILPFEQRMKAHMQWLGQQGETWPWWIFSTAFGDNLRTYVFVSGGHSFADLDAHAEFGRLNRERFLAGPGQHVESVAAHISMFRADVSRPGGTPPTPLVWIERVRVKAGMTQEFEHAVKQVHEGIGKTNWPGRYVIHQAIAGTANGTYFFIFPGDKWTDFTPAEKSFEAMLEEAYGRQGAENLVRAFAKAEAEASTVILAHRPDLSYTPPQQ